MSDPRVPGIDDDPRTLQTVLVGVVGIALTVVTVLLLEVLHVRTAEREFRRKVVQEQPEKLRSLQIEQLETLNGYRWVNRQEGLVAIPIERAMQLLVEESGGKN